MVSAQHRIAGRTVEDLVLARLDRALEPNEEDALETHLRGCRECAVFAARQERLHRSLRALAPTPRVDADDRERIWAGIASRRATGRAPWPRIAGQLALAASVLLVAALAGFLLIQSRPAAGPPVRELVATQTADIPGGTATVSVLQGSAFARAGARSGVGVEAALSFTQGPAAGSAEIRFHAPGDASYGVLGASPDLRSLTRAAFGGVVPRPAGSEPVTYQIWLHIETDAGTSDTRPLTVQLIATHDGERAEAR